MAEESEELPAGAGQIYTETKPSKGCLAAFRREVRKEKKERVCFRKKDLVLKVRFQERRGNGDDQGGTDRVITGRDPDMLGNSPD